jgi:spoIIIJ-associated protein
MNETEEITGTTDEGPAETEPTGAAGTDADGTEGQVSEGGDEADLDVAETESGPDEEPDGQGRQHDGDDQDDQDEQEETGSTGAATSLQDRLENEGDIAADYLEELLDIADLDGDLDMDVEGERAVVSVVGADLSQLVGERGEVLEALQELTRLAVYRETGERSRLMLDVSGHRAEVRRQLEELAATTAVQVKETGARVALRAMTPFERKVVHDAVAAAGLTSESEGVEPRRYVVVLPA